MGFAARGKPRLPKWCGERPGKKAGDPETWEGEEVKQENVVEDDDELEDLLLGICSAHRRRRRRRGRGRGGGRRRGRRGGGRRGRSRGGRRGGINPMKHRFSLHIALFLLISPLPPSIC